MILILCLDDRNGMSFLGRRQSQDSALRRHMLEMTEASLLWMSEYSQRQFVESYDHVRVASDPVSSAGDGEYCFVEKGDVMAAGDRVEKLVVYRWNRHYPSDVDFSPADFAGGIAPQVVAEFAGTSHERITVEVYDL